MHEERLAKNLNSFYRRLIHTVIIREMKEWIKKRLGEITLKIFTVFLLFFISVILFGLLAHIVVWRKEDLFDSKAFIFFQSFSTPGFLQLMKAITFFGSSYFLAPAYIIIITVLLVTNKISHAIDIGTIALTSTALKTFLKNYFQRSRPELPFFETLHTYSFPSGHALSSFIFSVLLIYLTWKSNLNKPWKWALSLFLLLFTLSIGISRIVLRYHYASDVLAGFCLGFAWVLFSLWIQRRISKKLRERNNKPLVPEPKRFD